LKKLSGLILIIGTMLFLAHYLGAAQRLAELRGWIASLGWLGIVIFVLIYAAAVTAFVPASALTIAAGSMFGSLRGVVIVSIASTLGAGLSFIISRYLARDIIAKWLEKNKKFNKLDGLTQTHGNIIVAVTRLIPIFPYTLLNYGFGLTKVTFKTYIFWSWLCMIPGTVLYVVGTDAVAHTIISGKVAPLHIAALAGAVIIIIFATRYARRLLKRGNNEI
jgi:uncharacterized membrane protein YdjX (TVP38/TMEM64 family)